MQSTFVFNNNNKSSSSMTKNKQPLAPRTDIDLSAQRSAVAKSRKTALKSWVQDHREAATFPNVDDELSALKMLITESHFFQKKNCSNTLENALRARCKQAHLTKALDAQGSQVGGLRKLTFEELQGDVELLYSTLLKKQDADEIRGAAYDNSLEVLKTLPLWK